MGSRAGCSAAALCAILLMGMFGTAHALTQVLGTQKVLAAFQNPAYTAPPQGVSVVATSTMFFSGSVCGAGPTPCPSSNVAQLSQSAFGQPFARHVPYVGFVQKSVDSARAVLYDPSTGAFRYQFQLYGKDAAPSTAIVNLLDSRSVVFANLYTASDQARVVEAERTLRNALKYAPLDKSLRQALLDLYYDRAVAEVMTAKERFSAAAKARLEPYTAAPAPSVVDREIIIYADAIAGYKAALAGYFELLNDPVGVNVAEFDPSAGSVPFGYYLFQKEVPQRALRAAVYRDAAGLLRDVSTDLPVSSTAPPITLFSGYKDLTMVFNLLADLADAVKEQTRLYAMRGLFFSDGPILRDLIKQAEEKIYLEGNILLGVFPAGALPAANHASGLQPSINRWSASLSSLSGARGWVEGKTNALGFDPEFLMLAQSSGTNFDTYDALYPQIDPTATGSLLKRAIDASGTAISQYDSYRGTQDQLRAEYQNRRITYDSRLFSLVGAHRCNISGADCSGQCPDTNGACYATPAKNVGSAVNLQVQSIDIANKRTEQALARMENLHRQIEIEIDRRGQAKGIENAIAQVMLDYGSQQAKLSEAIGSARAKAARAQRNAGVVNGILSGAVSGAAAGGIGAFAGAVMGGATAAYTGNANIRMEQQVGRLSGEKERMAAQERATINDLSGQILDIDSAALIKTWWLQASTLALEIEETELLIAQELARLKSIAEEIQDTERQMDQQNATLATRYFADPIHRLRMQNYMIHADQSFKEAQKWVFFALRALEYKWNLPFYFYDNTKTWSQYDVFEVTNAEGLGKLVDKMKLYNISLQFSALATNYFDIFSIRDDFFGYRELVNGVAQMYPDPQTGVMVDSRTAFRSMLKSKMDVDGNVVLDFSTVRDVPNSSFFQGPRFSSTGTRLTKGLYLDKINWIQLAVPGLHTTIGSQVVGELKYGGVSFLRDQNVGMPVGRADHVVGEMTPFPTRYWYFDGKTSSWKFSDGLSTPVKLEKHFSSKVPPTTLQSDIFKERSVAATEWKLTVFTKDAGSGLQFLNVDEADDIEIYFNHHAHTRP